MFTGIIEEIGRIEQIQKGRHSAVLTIRAQIIPEDLKAGDSIAVNGICLTVISFSSGSFSADVMHETLNRSAFAHLKRNSRVNLERAMPANGRFGGHIVTGHVDGVGKIIGIRRDDTAIWYTLQAEPSVMRYIVEKGSVAIDGISLTVARKFSDRFSVSAIPHTVRVTTLNERREGDLVNLENDIIGKYVDRLLNPAAAQQADGTLTKEFLLKCGY